MIALEIAFPAGRFHVTPWDRAVNEGEVEWPPSPWRLLCALIAGYINVGGSDPGALVAVLDRLCEAPRFILPPAVAGHTRHYMPRDGPTKALVLDAFVAVERAACAYAVWDAVEFDNEQQSVLQLACSGITYLGRAESWCTIRVVAAPVTDTEQITVDLASRSETTGPSARRLGVAADLRGHGLLDALSPSIDMLSRQRRLLPPGSAWLEYRFPPGFGRLPTEEVRAARARPAAMPPFTSLRFIVEGRNVRPPIAETLAVAEAFRKASMKCYSSLMGGEIAPSDLSGKAHEQPLSGHAHMFILPRDLDHDGRIDHVDVWFPAAVAQATFRSVRSVRSLWDWRLGRDEMFSLTYLGPAPRERSCVWRTATPFLLGKHVRQMGSDARRARYASETQLLDSLKEHGFDPPHDVAAWSRPAVLEHERGGATLLASFRSARKNDRVIGAPLGFTIAFANEVEGPIAVGRYAHFGMGQFEAVL